MSPSTTTCPPTVSFRVALFGCLLAVATLQGAVTRATLLEGSAPDFPASLVSADVNQGHALVLAVIDDTGAVLDVWTLEASHPAFAEAGERALAGWRYAPKSESAAMPWTRLDAVRFAFSRAGQITTLTHAAAAAKAFPQTSVLSARLDKLPQAKTGQLIRRSGSAPKLPTGTPAGETLVGFVVDRSGRLRLPIVLEATHPEHARAALDAMRTWNFYPPAGLSSSPGIRARWRFRFPSPAAAGG